MDLDSAKIDAVRPYIFDYTTGVLWLTASVMALVREEHLHRLGKAVDLLASETSHVKLPTVVAGFMVVIAGVILPYCVNIVLKLPTLRLLNYLLSLQRRASGEEAKKADELRRMAVSAIQRLAGIDADISAVLSLLYLETLLPTIGASLRSARQEILFKAYAALPIALIVGFVTGRLLSVWVIVPVAISIGLALGIGSFLVSVWSTNEMLDNTYEDLAIALMIANAKRGEFTK